MAYTTRDFKSKKALKDAIASGERVTWFQPNDMFNSGPKEGETRSITLEGPHYPKPHTWYAQAIVEGSVVKKVK